MYQQLREASWAHYARPVLARGDQPVFVSSVFSRTAEQNQLQEVSAILRREIAMTVTTAIQSATRAIGSIISGTASEPEILDTLKQEHEEVADMLKKLVDSESGVARKNTLAKIKAALLPHIEAEQTVLYDALIAVGDKKIQQDGKEGYIEHELAALTLAKLEKISNAMSPEFGAAAKVLKELIEHHVKEEERAVWADAKDKFSTEERMAMNQKYLAAKKLIGAPRKIVKDIPKKAAAAVQAKKAVTAAPKKPIVATPVKVAIAPKKATGAPKAKAASKTRQRPAAHPTG